MHIQGSVGINTKDFQFCVSLPTSNYCILASMNKALVVWDANEREIVKTQLVEEQYLWGFEFNENSVAFISSHKTTITEVPTLSLQVEIITDEIIFANQTALHIWLLTADNRKLRFRKILPLIIEDVTDIIGASQKIIFPISSKFGEIISLTESDEAIMFKDNIEQLRGESRGKIDFQAAELLTHAKSNFTLSDDSALVLTDAKLLVKVNIFTGLQIPLPLPTLLNVFPQTFLVACQSADRIQLLSLADEKIVATMELDEPLSAFAVLNDLVLLFTSRGWLQWAQLDKKELHSHRLRKVDFSEDEYSAEAFSQSNDRGVPSAEILVENEKSCSASNKSQDTRPVLLAVTDLSPQRELDLLPLEGYISILAENIHGFVAITLQGKLHVVHQRAGISREIDGNWRCAEIGDKGWLLGARSSAALRSHLRFEAVEDGRSWQRFLPSGEEIEGVAFSSRFVVAASSRNRLHIFTPGGSCVELFCFPGKFIVCRVFEKFCALITLVSLPVAAVQQISLLLYDLEHGSYVMETGVPLRARERLNWLGFSAEGRFLVQAGRKRLLLFVSEGCWATVHETHEAFQVVGVTETGVYTRRSEIVSSSLHLEKFALSGWGIATPFAAAEAQLWTNSASLRASTHVSCTEKLPLDPRHSVIEDKRVQLVLEMARAGAIPSALHYALTLSSPDHFELLCGLLTKAKGENCADKLKTLSNDHGHQSLLFSQGHRFTVGPLDAPLSARRKLSGATQPRAKRVAKNSERASRPGHK